MTTPDAQRQRRLAQHYLHRGETPARMNSTIAVAAQTLGFSRGQINILDDKFQYTVSSYQVSGVDVLPRDDTMCQFVIAEGDVVAVQDARADPRFAALPVVQEGTVGSYLGVPLRSRESAIIGVLCVLDAVPRRITAADIVRIRQYGDIAEDQLDLLRRAGQGPVTGPASVARLARAIADDEIVPWYQPVVNLGSGKLIGYEALARWQHPGGPVDDPSRFVAVAEDSDLIMDMDRAVMRRALRDVRRLRERDPDVAMGVNLSTRHLEAGDGIAAIVSMTEEAGLEADGIVFELTETRALDNVATARSAVAALRRLGYRVLLDDFGSGWSSLDWVLRLDVDGLKVDRAVTTAVGSRIGDAVMRAIVGLCNELDLDTVVEGIENPAHAAMALDFGFENGQGYFWSPPRPFEELADLAAS